MMPAMDKIRILRSSQRRSRPKRCKAVGSAGRAVSSPVSAGGVTSSTMTAGGATSSTVSVIGTASSSLPAIGTASSPLPANGATSSPLTVVGATSTLQLASGTTSSLQLASGTTSTLQLASSATPALQLASGTEASQKWVPLLLLDISDGANAPVLPGLPVTSGLVANPAARKAVVTRKAILVTKSSAGSTSTTSIPIMTKRISIRSSIPDTKQIIITADEPAEDPLALPVATTDDLDHRDDNEKPIRCLFCEQRFNSLDDMQAHYLSTHKARRCRDGRKRKPMADTEAPALPKTTQCPSDREGHRGPDNPSGFPILGTDVPKCPVCSIAFKTTEEVKSHIEEVHAYICSECNNTFYNLFHFTSHKCNKGAKKLRRVRRRSSGRGKAEVDGSVKGFSSAKSNGLASAKSRGRKRGKNSSEVLNGDLPPLQRIENILSTTTTTTSTTTTTTSTATTTTAGSIPTTRATTTGSLTSRTTTTGPITTRAATTTGPVTTTNAAENVVSSLVEIDSQRDIGASGALPASGVESVTSGAEVDRKDFDRGSFFLPSISTAYTLKAAASGPSTEDRPTRITDQDAGATSIKCSATELTQIDATNIHQARCLVQSAETTDAKPSSAELIREKIAQLKNNPYVSISWLPSLTLQKQAEDEFVCGRCNVICDDIDDYMDHIQDCLYITSVTLERTSRPPRRLLRLPVESSGFRETNNNRYSVNKNLISKLKRVLPQRNDLGHAQDVKPPPSAVNSAEQAFRDLLDYDYGYESHESVDHTGGSASPVSPGGRASDPPANSVVPNGQASTGGPKTAPMVVIPLDSKADFNLPTVSDPMLNQSSPTSTSASPLGMLLDQDEIKMEVEEEVVEDHYEES